MHKREKSGVEIGLQMSSDNSAQLFPEKENPTDPGSTFHYQLPLPIMNPQIYSIFLIFIFLTANNLNCTEAKWGQVVTFPSHIVYC